MMIQELEELEEAIDQAFKYDRKVLVEEFLSNSKEYNISVLNKIADKIDYSRVLGLNSTVITIKN